MLVHEIKMSSGFWKLIALGAQDLYLLGRSRYFASIDNEEYSEELPMDGLMQLLASVEKYEAETTEQYRQKWQSNKIGRAHV